MQRKSLSSYNHGWGECEANETNVEREGLSEVGGIGAKNNNPFLLSLSRTKQKSSTKYYSSCVLRVLCLCVPIDIELHRYFFGLLFPLVLHCVYFFALLPLLFVCYYCYWTAQCLKLSIEHRNTCIDTIYAMNNLILAISNSLRTLFYSPA